MRRLFYYIITLVVLSQALSCSYNDKSTYRDFSKNDFSLDTSGVSVIQYSEAGEVYTMSPKIDYQDFDPQKFSYQWDITLKPSTFQPTAYTTSCTSFDTPYMTISTEKDLVWQVESLATAYPYKLRLKITNEANGQKCEYVWYLYVSVKLNKGFMVAYSANETTSDLALITDPIWNERVDELSVHTEYYSEGMGAEFPGIIHNLQWFQDYNNMGLANTYLFLNSPTHIEQFDITNQKTYRKDEENFFDYSLVSPLKDAQVLCFDKQRMLGTMSYLYNDGGFYYRTGGNQLGDDNAKYGVCYVDLRGYFYGQTGEFAQDYIFDPIPPIAVNGNKYGAFDQKGSRFVYALIIGGAISPCPVHEVPNSDNIPEFSPEYLKNWRPIYGGAGGRASAWYYIMKNGSNYALAAVRQTKCVGWYPLNDIAPEIDNIVSFCSASNQPALWYGTKTGKLYSIYVNNTNTLNVTLEKNFGSEVNFLKIITRLNHEDLIPAIDELYMFVGTTTGQTNGTLHFIKLDNIGSGHIIPEPLNSYPIPGKIHSVTNIL